MKVRRMCLDVDKASKNPTVFEIAEAINQVPGVEAANITITSIDMETVGMDIIIEGENLDYKKIISAIESSGAVVHSTDELVIGERIIPFTKRQR
jgi:hypothetical protein